jgi:hypothetical protein
LTSAHRENFFHQRLIRFEFVKFGQNLFGLQLTQSATTFAFTISQMIAEQFGILGWVAPPKDEDVVAHAAARILQWFGKEKLCGEILHPMVALLAIGFCTNFKPVSVN